MAAGNAGLTSGLVLDKAVRWTVAHLDGGLFAPDGNEAGARRFSLDFVVVEAENFLLRGTQL